MSSIRVSTSTFYDAQTQRILDKQNELQQYAKELSTGLHLQQPSDDPIAVGQVMQISTDISRQDDLSKNATLASNQLSTVDTAMNNLTNTLQSARTLAVQGANGLLSDTDRAAIANQVDQLLTQAVGIANTQYNGSYIFAGTAATPNGPVSATGTPTNGVNIYGNNQSVTQDFGGGTKLPISTTLQKAFNVDAADDTKNVFDSLRDLRDALNGTSVSITTNGVVAKPGQVVLGTQTLAAAPFAKPLAADSNGNYSIEIIGSGGQTTLTFTGTDTINNVVAAINGANVGVTANYNQKTSQFELSSPESFVIRDVASTGATSTGNLVEAFGLPQDANPETSIAAKIGDIDNVLQVSLAARSEIGATIQSLSTIKDNAAVKSTNEIASRSALQDTNVPDVSAKFALTQTALQAAYAVTSRVEGHILFDYL